MGASSELFGDKSTIASLRPCDILGKHSPFSFLPQGLLPNLLQGHPVKPGQKRKNNSKKFQTLQTVTNTSMESTPNKEIAERLLHAEFAGQQPATK